LACVVMVAYDVVATRRSMVADLSTLMDVIVDNSTAALTFHDPKVAQELLNTMKAQPHVTAACIYASDGKPFASYSRDAAAGTFFPPKIQAYGASFSGNDLHAFRGIRFNGELIGTAYLESDFSAMNAKLRTYPVVVFLVLLISSGTSLLL